MALVCLMVTLTTRICSRIHYQRPLLWGQFHFRQRQSEETINRNSNKYCRSKRSMLDYYHDMDCMCKTFVSTYSVWAPFWRFGEHIRWRWYPARWRHRLQCLWSALSGWRHMHGVRLGPEERTGGWLSLLDSLRGSTPHPHRARPDQPPPKETCWPRLLKVVKPVHIGNLKQETWWDLVQW